MTTNPAQVFPFWVGKVYILDMNRLPRHKREQIINMLCEGSSMRSTSRIADVSIMTVMKLLVDVGEACERFHDRAVRGVSPAMIECDELWSYCYAKENRRVLGEPDYSGNLWTWVAIDPETRLVLSWAVSPERDTETATRIMTDVRERIDTPRPRVTTDSLNSYRVAMESAFGSEGDHRTKSKGFCTSHIERHNMTTRTFVRRFTRLTNAFSKKVRNHELALALYLVWYNFVRSHGSLGPLTTPAVAAGLAEFPMKIGDILDLVDS